MFKQLQYTLQLALLFSVTTPVLAVQLDTLAPPPVRVVDELGINVATGQPVQSLTTVSIGAERGLSHDMRVYTNHLDGKKSLVQAYIDKYAGNARYVKVSNNDAYLRSDEKGILTPQVYSSLVDDGNHLWLMRVFGPAGSHEFMLNSDGASFTPVGDLRHSLRHEIRDGRSTLIWRTPEGIESLYWATTGGNTLGESGVSGKRDLRAVIYPDGFKLTIEEGAVTTNTGFMLKYGLPKYGEGNSRWVLNPNYIAGINLAVQHCASARGSACDTDGWPTARFGWPPGAPESLFNSEGMKNIIKVTDQHGGITEYHYETHNICRFSEVDGAGVSQWCLERNPGDNRFSPRLVAVKSAHSSTPDFRYTYKNDGRFTGATSDLGLMGIALVQTYWDVHTKEGVLTKGVHQNRSVGYGKPWEINQAGDYARGGVGVARVEMSASFPNVFQYVSSTKDGNFYFEINARNFVTSHVGPSGLRKHYSYDHRGNLHAITANGVTVMQALYPASCTNANFRYCNKPVWVKDGKGAQTDYSYHVASGQVASVTGPAVSANGVSTRPATRYQYTQKYAYYRKHSDSVERADSPLWLPASEFHCRTTNANPSGCDGGELDTVRTHYYYGPQDGSPNNLLLRGKSVTAEGDVGVVSTRVTCYAYDNAGNRIAETLPKGASVLESCP